MAPGLLRLRISQLPEPSQVDGVTSPAAMLSKITRAAAVPSAPALSQGTEAHLPPCHSVRAAPFVPADFTAASRAGHGRHPDAWSIGASLRYQLAKVDIEMRADPLLCWRVHPVWARAVETGTKHPVAALIELAEGVQDDLGCVGCCRHRSLHVCPHRQSPIQQFARVGHALAVPSARSSRRLAAIRARSRPCSAIKLRTWRGTTRRKRTHAGCDQKAGTESGQKGQTAAVGLSNCTAGADLSPH
jgi:hypothetical protein